MARNSGFSAPVNYWMNINGLTPKSSSDGKTSQLAEAQSEFGDTIAFDEFGEVLAPSVEYAVTSTITNAMVLITLGGVQTKTIDDVAYCFIPTTVVVNTQAGQPPTVTISGVQAESNATPKRDYRVKINLSPRSKAQDVVGAFTPSNKFTSITTTFSVDPHIQTVAGVPVASDVSHGKVEVQATMIDATGTDVIEIAEGTTFKISGAVSENHPDAGYVTKSVTAFNILAGSEVSQSQSLQSTPPPSGDETRSEADGEADGDDNSR